MTAVLRPALSRVWSPDADGGMQLGLWAHVEGRDQTVLTVLADPQDESLWVGVQLGETRLQLPLVVLRQALEAADAEVHSAAWFARQDEGVSEI